MIAWIYALRFHLRGQEGTPECHEKMTALLSETDCNALDVAASKVNMLMFYQGRHITEAFSSEMLSGLEFLLLENSLTALMTSQTTCERIKNTPLLRQYLSYTKMMVWTMIGISPFCLLSVFVNNPSLVIPFNLLSCFFYIIVDGVSTNVMDPFENHVQDVPVSALSVDIDRDLREMLGEQKLPDRLLPVDGYLY